MRQSGFVLLLIPRCTYCFLIMAQQSDIEWTDATWNPWQGCEKVSQGCKFCYAERLSERFGKKFSYVFRSSEKTFFSPLKWKQQNNVFTCSISDFFIKEADPWRNEAWDIIRKTQHRYLILTKRPHRPECLPPDWGNGYNNVYLGTSGETAADIIKRSREIATVPAKYKFISIEPLLESVSDKIGNALDVFHWVIVGGESGSYNKFRNCEAEWIAGIVNLCKQKNIPVFVKQMGSRYAKKHNMNNFKGGNIDQFPKNLQIREFPWQHLK